MHFEIIICIWKLADTIDMQLYILMYIYNKLMRKKENTASTKW